MTERCSNCKVGIASHRSAMFPSVALCRPCSTRFIEKLWLLGVADRNPLVAELWDASNLRVICPVLGGSRPIRGYRLVAISEDSNVN